MSVDLFSIVSNPWYSLNWIYIYMALFSAVSNAQDISAKHEQPPRDECGKKLWVLLAAEMFLHLFQS
jgi:hypothetical protein